MTEAELQEKVRAMCAQLGLYHYHPHDSRRSSAGWPDSVIISQRTRRMIFRELKTESGTLTSEQKRVGYLLVAAGEDWAVWKPHDLHDGSIGAELAWLAGYRQAVEDIINKNRAAG
jgi:hypothetical protein